MAAFASDSRKTPETPKSWHWFAWTDNWLSHKWTFLTRSHTFTLVGVNGWESATRDLRTMQIGHCFSVQRSPISQRFRLTVSRRRTLMVSSTPSETVKQIRLAISRTNRVVPPSEIQWDDSPIGVKWTRTRASSHRLFGSIPWRGRLDRPTAVCCIQEPVHH